MEPQFLDVLVVALSSLLVFAFGFAKLMQGGIANKIFAIGLPAVWAVINLLLFYAAVADGRFSGEIFVLMYLRLQGFGFIGVTILLATVAGIMSAHNLLRERRLEKERRNNPGYERRVGSPNRNRKRR